MIEISVHELAQKLGQSNAVLQLIDVREIDEVAIAKVDGFKILPLSQHGIWSAQISNDFDPTIETLVLCHHGIRSQQMCHWLRSIGFTNVKNIVGGIDRYSRLIDPTIALY